jgi:hypothetical protein
MGELKVTILSIMLVGPFTNADLGRGAQSLQIWV